MTDLLAPHLSPLVTADHLLGAAALDAEGVDRFFAVSPGLLCIAGFDGYFKMLNPAWERTLGYSVDELCGKPYLELVHPDDREKATDEALEIRGGHTVFRFTNRYRCKDGSYRWLAWSATPDRGQGLIYASARDVTNSVRTKQWLHESNDKLREVGARREVLLRESTARHETLVELTRFKDEMTAMLIHDLKTPLAVVLSNYDYIVEGFEGSADFLEALQDSQVAGRRMLRLLANLVDVASIEDGTLKVSAAETSLALLIQPVSDQRRVLARARQISIVHGPFPEMTVAVDADLLTRTMENIFDNALRHTPNGGRIQVDVRGVGPEVEIRIGNSGCAIPPDARRTIFDKYQQAGAEVGHMNLGLGLYFCRLAIEAQHGRIWIEETEHLPTVFVIRMPRLTAHMGSGAPAESSGVTSSVPG